MRKFGYRQINACKGAASNEKKPSSLASFASREARTGSAASGGNLEVSDNVSRLIVTLLDIAKSVLYRLAYLAP